LPHLAAAGSIQISKLRVKERNQITPVTTDLRAQPCVAHMEIAGMRSVGGDGGEKGAMSAVYSEFQVQYG
jgi:hypothetical protein